MAPGIGGAGGSVPGRASGGGSAIGQGLQMVPSALALPHTRLIMQPAPAPADQVQRRLALEPGRSFIVQAPAGSGKTELLIQRYLVLLEGVAQPESILAITFTRKAAAEMRSRILQAMRRAGSEAEPETANEALTWRLARAALEQDRRHGWQLERNPSRLRIQTIDALCVSITGRMPWLARFGAMPEIVEQAKALYEEAARATLYLLEGEDQYAASVERLVAHLDNKAGVAQYLLAGLLDRRDQWLRHLAAGDDPAAWRREMERLLERAGRICVEKLRDLFPEELVEETLTLARYAAGNLQEDAGVPESGLPEDVEGWRAVAQLLITQDGKGWRKQVTKRQGFPTTNRGMIQRFYSVRDELDKVEGLFEAFRELRYAPPPHYEDQQWELMEDLLEVLPAAAAQLKVVFQRRGAVDFTELTHAALRALGEEGEPTDLAFSLGHRVEHILVDEMQDTSHSQVRLLTMLTAAWEPGDGRTLFLVGDPMQSIYRFREAEVGLFVRMCAEGLPALPLERLQLSANFRSDAELVDWVNQSFAGIFPAAADFSSGAVPYNASVAFRPAAGAEAVTIHTQASDDADAEARLVAELVEKSAGGTTAILVRARGHLPPIVEELKRRGIAYRAVEIDPLTTRPVIRDLLALTRAILHPGDRTAWLAILRAPWCGLTLEQLHRLAADDAKAIMWDRITPSTPALARFHKAMAGALSRVRRQRLRSSVERAWIELGGPACLGGEIEYQEAKRYFEKLESMEQGGEVDDFARLEAALEELHAAPDAGAPETLEIMTIHKAKGLEFDTVIVPGLARETQSGEGGLLHWATI
ncbi:MAG: DNA helicase UvrD, partial [Acidimicrobiia bacterium]|nr:DNA helicase UvrD [Acidimicrobiia bacterium]